MRHLISITVVATALVALIGCGGAGAPSGYAPGQEVEAYAYVHGGYVGQAIVTTDSEGSLSVSVDEAFLPHTVAIVDLDAPEWNEDNTASYVVRGNTVNVARYVAYNGTAYTGVTVGSALAYVESDDEGNPIGNTILEKAILRNQDTMATWFDSVQEGGFEIFTEFGGSGMPVTSTSYGGVTKRDSNYWDSGLGWAGNIDEIENAAENLGVGFTLGEMVRGDDDRWRLADTVTRATASDFKDYFGLIQAAAGRLKLQ